MLAIYGYPAEKYSRNTYGEEKVNQWGYTRRGGVFGLGENEDEIFHKMTTLPGQSGCPIIEIGPKRSLTIVGIHKGGRNAEIQGQKVKVNIGRLITSQLIATLEQKVKGKAQMFKII
jgi:V8-like Glu-specific endopeptidase